MNTFKSTIILSALLCTNSLVFAVTDMSPISAFTMKQTIHPVQIIVPTVVAIPFSGTTLEQRSFLVYEQESKKFIPSYYKEDYTQLPEPLFVSATHVQDAQALIDDNQKTNVNFKLQPTGDNTATITISSRNAVTSSKLVLSLDKNVAMPISVALRAQSENGMEQIIARKTVTSNVITFPQTTSNTWFVTFEYAQPLRINELRLVQDDVEELAQHTLRFLAQPQRSYVIYFNPDRTQSVSIPESGNLRADEDVLLLRDGTPEANSAYTKADKDDDGIPDTSDNCTTIANPEQEDIDGNGTGDVCDDYDRDSVTNSIDNCQNDPNVNQSDEDGDGIGDICDQQESRLTERYTWVPWVGMGTAFLVLIGLFAVVGLKPKNSV